MCLDLIRAWAFAQKQGRNVPIPLALPYQFGQSQSDRERKTKQSDRERQTKKNPTKTAKRNKRPPMLHLRDANRRVSWIHTMLCMFYIKNLNMCLLHMYVYVNDQITCMWIKHMIKLYHHESSHTYFMQYCIFVSISYSLESIVYEIIK